MVLFRFEFVNLPAPDMVRKVVLAFISEGLQFANLCVFMSFEERKERDPTENLCKDNGKHRRRSKAASANQG
jgi:hypothetical protein